LNGIQVSLSGPIIRDNLHFADLRSVGPNEIQAYVPKELAPGNYKAKVVKGDQSSPEVQIKVGVLDDGLDRVNPSFPISIFTRNGLGYGTADATDENGDPITFNNPLVPGGVANINFQARDGAGEIYFDLYGRLIPAALRRDETERAPVGGVSTVQLRLPEDWPSDRTGCAVPVVLNATNPDGRVWTGTPVTLPVSKGGPCNDRFGLSSSDIPRLGSGGIKTLEFLMTEGTVFNPTRTDRILGRLSGAEWNLVNFGEVPPVDTCSYRWVRFPLGGIQVPNPNAATPLALGGAASMALPWGLFNFSPASTYTLVFANPANFTEGNYSLNHCANRRHP